MATSEGKIFVVATSGSRSGGLPVKLLIVTSTAQTTLGSSVGSEQDKRNATTAAKKPEASEHSKEQPGEDQRASRVQDEPDWRKLEEEVKKYIESRPSSPGEERYFGKAASTVFEDVLKKLKASAETQEGQKNADEARKRANELFKDAKGVEKDVGTLLKEVGLRRPYDKYEAYVNRRLNRAKNNLRREKLSRAEGFGTQDTYKLAEDEVRYLTQLSKELRGFREGKLANRKFDAVQLFVKSSRIVVIDPTFRVKEIFHQLKSAVYGEMWRNVFPKFRVEVWEFRSDTAIYEVPPTPDLAKGVEKTVDLQNAREQ